jgi:hypothetical protein
MKICPKIVAKGRKYGYMRYLSLSPEENPEDGCEKMKQRYLLCLCLPFNKIRDKGRTGSTWK